MANTTVTTQDLSRFAQVSRRIIALCRLLEWDIRWTNSKKQSVVLRAETGRTIVVPTTNVNNNRVKQWLRTIVRNTDSKKLSNLYEGHINLLNDPDAAEIVATFGTDLRTLTDAYTETVETLREAVEEAEKVSDNLSQEKEEAVPTVAEAISAPEKEALRQVKVTPASDVVARRPWLARQTGEASGSGVMYESPYVDVVTLTNGAETFECRQCKTWRNDNPRSVASHSTNAHGAIVGEKVRVIVRDYEPSGLVRGQSAAKRLANDIVSALDSVAGWREMDEVELASTLAEVMVDTKGTRPPTEPLTDAQVVARITSLLDRGQVAEMHKQMSQLSEALRMAEQTAEEANARAERVESSLTALRDLLNETAATR